MAWSRAGPPRQSRQESNMAYACRTTSAAGVFPKAASARRYPLPSSSSVTAAFLGNGRGLGRRASLVEARSLSPTSSGKALARSPSSPSTAAVTVSLAELASKAQEVQDQLGVELASLTGLSAEVSSHLALSSRSLAVNGTPLNSASAATSARSSRCTQQSNGSCISAEPAEAEAAAGRRPAAPVGARHRKASPAEGGREDVEKTLQELLHMASRCRMAIEHTESMLEGVRQDSESSRSPSWRQAASKRHVVLYNELSARLEENQSICQDSAALCLRALRRTSAGLYEPPSLTPNLQPVLRRAQPAASFGLVPPATAAVAAASAAAAVVDRLQKDRQRPDKVLEQQMQLGQQRHRDLRQPERQHIEEELCEEQYEEEPHENEYGLSEKIYEAEDHEQQQNQEHEQQLEEQQRHEQLLDQQRKESQQQKYKELEQQQEQQQEQEQEQHEHVSAQHIKEQQQHAQLPKDKPEHEPEHKQNLHEWSSVVQDMDGLQQRLQQRQELHVYTPQWPSEFHDDLPLPVMPEMKPDASWPVPHFTGEPTLSSSIPQEADLCSNQAQPDVNQPEEG